MLLTLNRQCGHIFLVWFQSNFIAIYICMFTDFCILYICIFVLPSGAIKNVYKRQNLSEKYKTTQHIQSDPSEHQKIIQKNQYNIDNRRSLV